MRDPTIMAPTASEDAQPGAVKPNAGYVYKVHIRTEQAVFLVDRKQRPIQSGMTVQADIVTDKRRLIDFFLSPVTKYLDEGLKVR